MKTQSIKQKVSRMENKMGRVFWFCDSQRNILSAYFMKKIYFDTDKYENILLVSNNSINSLLCAKRIEKFKIWDTVEIVSEAFADTSTLENICNKFCFLPGDEVCLFALQNRVARGLYKKANESKAKVLLIDEGVILFKDFLTWQGRQNNEVFGDIDVTNSQIDAWCYEPEIFELPSNVKLNKIDLVEYLQNEMNTKQMQLDVKQMFNIQEECNSQIIYFDQYYALSGRTTGTIEKYLLNEITLICSEYSFAIKPHPMERGFFNKYKGLEKYIMKSGNSPWEAIYFVNYYGQKDRVLICISGESTALSSILFMFGDFNYKIIILRELFKEYVKSSSLWSPELYFCKLLEKYPDNIYLPRDFEELQEIIQKLKRGKNIDKRVLIKETEKTLIQLNSDIMKCRPVVSIANLQILKNEVVIGNCQQEYVLEDGEFEFIYEIPKELSKNIAYTYRWIPCYKCFVSLKDIKIEILQRGNWTELPKDSFTSEQALKIDFQNYFENESHLPSFLLKCQYIGVEKIKLQGKWKIDFNILRITSTEEAYLIHLQEAQRREYEEKLKNSQLELLQINQELTYIKGLLGTKEDTINVLKDNINNLKDNINILKNENELLKKIKIKKEKNWIFFNRE